MIRSWWYFWLELQHWCCWQCFFWPVSVTFHLPQGTSQCPPPLLPVPGPQPLNPFNLTNQSQSPIEPFQFDQPITESQQILYHNIGCCYSMIATSLSRPEIRSGCAQTWSGYSDCLTHPRSSGWPPVHQNIQNTCQGRNHSSSFSHLPAPTISFTFLFR